MAYRGEEVKDWQELGQIPQTLCVLRPSDIVTTAYNLDNTQSISVFNLEEYIKWTADTEIGEKAIELVIYSLKNGPFLCSALASSPILILKLRIQRALSCAEAENMTLWYRGKALDDNSTLEACGLGDRSRVALQIEGEGLAEARDVEGNIAVFPVKSDDLLIAVWKTAYLLEPKWTTSSKFFEYLRIFPPISPIFTRFFRFSQPYTRFVTLFFEEEKTEKVLIPSNCSIGMLKTCIETQLGLPAALLSLDSTTELSFYSNFIDYGVENGDILTIIRKKLNETKLKITVKLGKQEKMCMQVASSCTILDIKKKIAAKFAYSDSDLVIFRENEILCDQYSLSDYGIYGNQVLFCENRAKPSSEISKSKIIPYISAQKCINSESEFSLELFDIGQKANRKERPERFEQYLENIRETLEIKLITPVSAQIVRIDPQATVKSIKNMLLKGKNSRIMCGKRQLNEDQTLIEQGISEKGTILVLVPAMGVLVTAVTPGEQQFPLVLEGNMQGLGQVLEGLTGLQPCSQRVILTKGLREDREKLPERVSSVLVSLRIGRGREVRVVSPSGIAVRVEVDPVMSVASIREGLEKAGVRGMEVRED